MKILFCVLLTVVTTDASCSMNSGDSYTFGPNCEYMCHCKGSKACDSVTGYCQTGCDNSWFGPGCQYRDIAENQISRHLDNVPQNLWSSRANDGDVTTCSETNYASANRTRNPWWRVWFPNTETITSLEFLTTDENLKYFKSFKVTIENIPERESTNVGYYPPFEQLCYQHSNDVPMDKKIYFMCDKQLKGNSVRIQLATKDTQLKLCDVRINGDAICNVSSGGIYRFGPNCEYMCHCKNGTPCERVRGDCQNGCAKKRFGPGCQYRDLAEGEMSQHLDNIVNLWSERANDGNLGTCSETNVSTASRTRSPWWRLWLPNNETITSLEILTRDRQLQYFNGFNVSVEYVPADKSGDREYYPPDPQLCYKHSNFTPTDRKIFVTCDKPLIGNQIRIQLASTKTQLVLCDVRVNGGRNIAFNKQVTSSSVYNNQNPPSTVVDGDVHNDSRNDCFLTYSDRFEWISINLNHISHITFVRLTYTGYSYINNYQLYISNTSAVNKSVTVHDDRGNNIPTTNITLEVIGQYIGIKRQSIYNTEICEMEVYGDCVSGKCGYDCSQKCNCKTLEDRLSGNCVSGCDGRWTNKEAQCLKKCGDNEWGSDCAKHCGVCKDSALCDVETGYCPNGCAAGYFDSPLCNTECPKNNYGENCSFRCSGNCKNGRPCRKSDGYCQEGCKPGYISGKCDKKCPDGKYGHNCNLNCSAHCHGGFSSCDYVNGTCIQGCKAGWKGQMCDEDCENGRYGENCQQSCGACAMNATCNHITGQCAVGCSRGYKHSLLCDEECDYGTHGENCTEACGNCKPGTFCDKVTGICLAGCVEGYKPGMCTKALKQGGDFPVITVVGGIAAAVVVITAVVSVLVFLKRKRKPIEKKSKNTIRFDAVAVQGNLKKSESHKRENVYINSVDIQEDDTGSKVPDPDKRLSNRKTYVITKVEDEGADIYYNEGLVSTRQSEYVIPMTGLEAYVKMRINDKGGFTKEFEKLPTGLQHPTMVAKKVENIGKNRYKALYAYDHSRVKLKMLPNLPDSDYINASLINGYFKNNAYIASQGPTKFNIHEFWRMIWEKDVFTIVMATKLVEKTKTKCMQYWPEEGETQVYGPIIVKTEAENIYAESKIRRLNVFHEDEPSKIRQVTQFHYTAWPDKDVPRSTTSLLHFWYQVRKHDESKRHPWLVHCSAGVGRTGTFIALDLLYDQGNDQGCIDVFQCVKDLRDQRVNMVQTKEQYRYLHNILVEALVLPWKPIKFEKVAAVHRDLQDIDNKTGKIKLFIEYETLIEETDSGSDLEELDEMYTSAEQKENRNKNRYDNILAPNDYRPYLFTHVKGRTNYINAVYMPSYCDTRGYILTQTPLPETAVDCCRLVWEQEVSAVVTFVESTNVKVGEYIPESGTINVGPFTVSLLSEEDKAHYKIKQYKLHFDSKKHSFTQLVCKQWPPSQVIPTDPNRILALLQELECIQRQEVNKPVVAQCLNGAERSGLIVVLMNILEHLRIHKEVSIPQVIRQLRIRRQQIIPNFEQYKFCYEVLLAHVESCTTYANL